MCQCIDTRLLERVLTRNRDHDNKPSLSIACAYCLYDTDIPSRCCLRMFFRSFLVLYDRPRSPLKQGEVKGRNHRLTPPREVKKRGRKTANAHRNWMTTTTRVTGRAGTQRGRGEAKTGATKTRSASSPSYFQMKFVYLFGTSTSPSTRERDG